MLGRCVAFVRQSRRSRMERQMSVEEQKGEVRAWEVIRKWEQMARKGRAGQC